MIEYDAYIGTKSCGCRVAVVVDFPNDDEQAARITANTVWGFIRDGLTVTREHISSEHPLAISACKCES